MVGRNAEVSEDTVDGCDPDIVEEIGDEAEIVPYERKAGIVGDIGEGIGILVEGDETAIGTEAVENLPAVATTTESDIDIGPVGANVEGIDRLVEKDWDVVCVGL